MDVSLTPLLEREHHEMDAGIEAFLEGLAQNEIRDQERPRSVGALRRHIYLEEEFLFPPLRASGLIPLVLVMLHEHGEIWGTLDAVEAADHQSDPDGA